MRVLSCVLPGHRAEQWRFQSFLSRFFDYQTLEYVLPYRMTLFKITADISQDIYLTISQCVFHTYCNYFQTSPVLPARLRSATSPAQRWRSTGRHPLKQEAASWTATNSNTRWRAGLNGTMHPGTSSHPPTTRSPASWRTWTTSSGCLQSTWQDKDLAQRTAARYCPRLLSVSVDSMWGIN